MKVIVFIIILLPCSCSTVEQIDTISDVEVYPHHRELYALTDTGWTKILTTLDKR